jgi:two-component system, CitB family, response regulator MalR
MLRVLIAEHDPMVAYLNRRYLTQVDGFICVAVTSSGKEALEILNAQEIDLLLLGIHLQDLEGLNLMAKIRTMSYPTDVIVITSVHDNHSIQTALRLGAVDYLIKPFEFERYNAALSNYKKRVKLLSGQTSLSQNDLDHFVLKMDMLQETELPKGIDRNTLKAVWEHITQVDGYFTTDEMAKYVGISRVSMRKYLDYLQQTDALKLEVSYGSIGRPVYKYRRIATSLPIFV